MYKNALKKRALKKIAAVASLSVAVFGSMLTSAAVVESTIESAVDAKRLVTIGSSTTELAFALGAGDKVVAVDVTSKHPVAALALPKVGYYRSLSAEGILSMQPDLLLGTDEMGPPPVLQQLQVSKVQIKQLPTGSDVDNLKKRIELTAGLLGKEAAGQQLWDRINTELNEAKLLIQDKRPRVLFMLSHTGTPMMAGKDTEIDSLITLAGGINVAAEHFSSYRQISAESLLVMQPDILIVNEMSLGDKTIEQLLALQPGLAATPAGQQQRVEVIDGTLLVGGLGPRTGQAVIELARKFYPNVITAQAD